VVLILVATSVVVGAVAQRVSGMGFGMIVAPVLVLAVGPVDGVLMVNVCGAASACMVTSRVWREVDWRRYAVLVLPALLAIGPGVAVAVTLGGPMLQVVVGVLLVGALGLSQLVTRGGRGASPTSTGIACGAASGFMSATVGVSGPLMGIYSVLTRVDHRTFAATVQPFFATLGATAFTIKMVTLPPGEHGYSWWLWVMIVGCTVMGLVLGERLQGRVSVPMAQRVVVVLAYGGSLLAVADGLVALSA